MTISPAWEDMNMTTEYFERTKHYTQKYGPMTLVLMQCGGFYEVYGHKLPEESSYSGSIIQLFSDTCEMSISKKKIQFEKRESVYMAGFRDYSLEKYLKKLTQNNFTVVVLSQKETISSETGTRHITRVLDGVYSPGTYVSFETQTDEEWSNYLMCVWIHLYKGEYSVGISLLNVYTGQSYISEHTLPSGKIKPTSFDELDKCLSIYRPKEVIFISDDPSLLENITFLRKTNISIHLYSTHETFIENATEQVYRNHVLAKYFGKESIVYCAEFSYYELATQCFCVLMNFLEEHNPNLCKRVQLPLWEKNNSLMLLANHTLQQLNILEEGKPKHTLSSVHSWTNKCMTVMGKRLFLEEITHPTFDETRLEKEYAIIEKTLQTEMVDTVRSQLKPIHDIQALSRQLMARKMYPSGLFKLYKSIEALHQMMVCFEEMDWLYEYLNITSWSSLQCDIQQFMTFIEARVHLELCSQLSQFDEPILKKGVYAELDKMYAEYETQQAQLSTIREFLERQMSPTSKVGDFVKYCTTEKNHISLQMTKIRCASLNDKMRQRYLNNPHEKIILENGVEFEWKDVTFVPATKTNMEIRFPLCDEICKSLGKFQTQLNKLTHELYIQLLSDIEILHADVIDTCCFVVARVDVLFNKCYIAKKYNYCRPTIHADAEKSFVKAYDLRHVLIEQINTNETYVTNDLLLGGVDDLTGMLLFGTNMVGKTSMMRALGISVIMAQAGMYVPCSRFDFKPYRSMFSRILNQDNFFKGLSTFGVEMSELRVILQYADENSLILGDELCSGTETVSALSIMMSSLIHLHKKRCSFLFATHFHEIVHYEEMQKLDKLKCFHLAISYDAQTERLVYDRVLKEGSGPRSYGLEICESLFMDKEFLENAYTIRKKHFPEYEGSLHKTKTRYNANKIKGICESCGNVGEDIHHLEEQQNADVNGFIGSFHKNHPANLMVLCEACHSKKHKH